MSSSEFDFRYFSNIDGKNYMLQDLGSDRHENAETIKKMYSYAKTLKLKGNDVVTEEPEKTGPSFYFYTNNYKIKIPNNAQYDYSTLTDLEVIVPITAEMKKYDKFQIMLTEENAKKEPIDRGVLFSIEPESKEYSIDYANKKEIKISLYNKASIDNKTLNPYLNRGTFFQLFKGSNTPFAVQVYGLLKTGTVWSDQQSAYVNTYKYKLLHTTPSISNNYKTSDNDCPFLIGENVYLLSAGKDITFINNRGAGTMWWYADSLKLSNGMVLEIKAVSLDNRTTMADKIKEIKNKTLSEQYIDYKTKQQIVKMEQEETNYFIYTNRETNLIGGAGKKILSSGMYYFGLSTDGKTLFYIFDKSKTLTKASDYASKIEFYKKLNFRPAQ